MSSGLIDPSHFSLDVRDFIRLLEKHEVRYLIVGGEAVIFYGHARLTGDVDFFYDGGNENSRRLYAALHEFWEGSVPGVEGAVELTEPGLIVQFGVPPNRIDLMNRIDAVEFEDAWKERTVVELDVGGGRITVNYVGLVELIKNKEAAARPKDLDDLPFMIKALELRRRKS
jgi:hypothetical protein